MTNLDSILKSRGITLPAKVCLVRAMVFPVVMYGCESWTIKKDEHRRIDAFELWCCRRLLRVPWTARRSNQSILKEISPGCSLEGLMLKLKLQYFGHLMRRATHLKRLWCWKRLKAGGERYDRGWDGSMASLTQWTWVWVWELVMDRKAWRAVVHGVTKSLTQLSDWTELNQTWVLLAIIFYLILDICLFIANDYRRYFRRRQWQPTPVLLPGKSHGLRSLVGCSPWGRWESGTTERLHFHFSLSCIGERNGSPLQCSCLENPRDGGAWWAAVYGVAQSQTWLKRLSSTEDILNIF